ncbi:flippase-like domain-containing protein [Candidatus Sumerlaeota bacterium]|nr:flippase-like domain-containing protein [Candidatus Sumerlaeota bacterium]
MTKSKLIRNLIYLLVVVVVVYSTMIIFGDFKKNLKDIGQFKWWVLAPALILILINFLIRELKWDFFRRQAGIDVPRKGSWLIYFSGFSMCISPGRIGELIKPFLLKDIYNAPYSKSVPLVFCERLTDLLGMIFLCIVTMPIYLKSAQNSAAAVEGGASGFLSMRSQLIIYLLVAAVFMIALIGMVRWRKFVYGCLNLMQRMLPEKISGKITEKISNLYESTFSLLTARNLLLMTMLAVFSWLWEILGVWVIGYGFGVNEVATFANIVFMFCIASIIGGFFFFLPGGLGGFEGSIMWLLAMIGLTGAQVFIFMLRVCTLFYGAAVGFIVLFYTSRIFHKNLLADLEQMEQGIEADDSSTGQSTASET